MCHTFMVCLLICAASAEYGITTLFAKRASIRQNAHFHGRSKDCCALQDGVLSEVRRTRRDKYMVRRANQCRGGAFVASLLMLTIS